MAAGLILLFVVVQMTLGLFFLLWLWVVLVKSAKNAHPDRREQLLRFAVISFTLAVALNFYFMLAHGSVEPSHKFAVFASFGLACLELCWPYWAEGGAELSQSSPHVDWRCRGCHSCFHSRSLSRETGSWR